VRWPPAEIRACSGMITSVLPRLALAVVAVLVVAGLGLMERNERLLARGQAAVDGPLGPREAARAASDLRAARLLNPDTTPELQLARLHAGQGRRDQAVALTRDVIGREPDNLLAWSLLLFLVGDDDPAAERQAQAEIRRLNALE
jgi:hypothetical protein